MSMRTLRPTLVPLAVLPLLLALFGCGGGKDSVVITVLDQERHPVQGVEIRLAGGGERLGVTDDAGQADIRPPRQEGESLIRLTPPPDAPVSYQFEPSYRITADEFRNGKKLIRAREGEDREATTASLRVISEPPGATILLNGAVAGTTDVLLTNLPLGRAEVVLKLQGMHPDTVIRFLEPGENPDYEKSLTPAEVTTASLVVTSDPSGGTIYLNGRSTGKTTPATFTELKPGSYRVRISLAGYQDYDSRVGLQAGKQGAAGGTLEKPRPRDTASGGGDQRPRDTGGTQSSGGSFSRSYLVSAAPGWAEIYVDGDPVNKNITGNFRITLGAGKHNFRVVNNQAGVNRVLGYEVKPGDPNGKLILNYETGRVVARP